MVEIPEELKEFGFSVDDEIEKVNETVYENLNIMKEQAEKVIDSYERYCQCEDERWKDDLLASMTHRINYISQTFRDIMAFIEIKENESVYQESLSYYIRKYQKRNISKTDAEKQAVEFLRRRNDMTHDYFNMSKLNQDLLMAMETYGNGFIEMADNLRLYCISHFPEIEMKKNIKKEIRKGQRK